MNLLINFSLSLAEGQQAYWTAAAAANTATDTAAPTTAAAATATSTAAAAATVAAANLRHKRSGTNIDLLDSSRRLWATERNINQYAHFVCDSKCG